jgi:hypothetical protein
MTNDQLMNWIQGFINTLQDSADNKSVSKNVLLNVVLDELNLLLTRLKEDTSSLSEYERYKKYLNQLSGNIG